MICRMLVAAFLILGLAGCEVKSPAVLADTGRAFGLIDVPPRPTRTVKIVIDPTVQSPASADSLAQVIDSVLPDIAERPTPSCVELWSMGATVNDALRVGEACVGEAERNTKAQRKAQDRFVRLSREHLLGLAQPIFNTRPRRSPIAETLSRVAASSTESSEQVLIVITDGREESAIARLECGPLPTPEVFAAALQKEWLMEPESFAGIHVRFCFMGYTDAKRAGCATSVRREKELQNLWRTAFERASARSVHFDAAAPRMPQEEVAQ